MRTFKNVRAIKFIAKFNGKGCVNFDSKEQKIFLKNTNLYGGKIYDNCLFAKKIFKTEKNDNGETIYKFKYKVSSECLRNAMFKENIAFQNPNIAAVPHILYNAIAMPAEIIRGYMFTQGTKNTLHKSTVITICDAVEIGPWRNNIVFDFHSCSGEKNREVKNDNDASDTTIYNIENVGNLTYESQGYIDLTEAQFISGDVIYDRMAIDADGGANERIYLDALKRNLPSLDAKFDFYYMANNYFKDEWAERGIFLDIESINTLTLLTLKYLLNINIYRRNAQLNIDKLFIKVICDGNEESEEIEITPSNVNDFRFEYYRKYFPADADLIRKNRELIKEAKKLAKESKQDKGTKQNKNDIE